MTFIPHLIANPRIGAERDLEPFLLPEDAYPNLEDCYLWRGRVKRRQSYQLLGRLNRQIGTTNGAGDVTIPLPNFPLIPGASQFQIGTEILQDPKSTAGGDPVTLLTTGSSVTTLNRITGVLTITGAAIATPVLYFPGLPVMALASLESVGQNNESIETLIAFDTKFAYLNVNSANPFSDLSNYKGTATIFNWTGTDYQFFWTYNYAGAMWATNSKPGFQGSSTATTGTGDGIRWLDQDTTGWVNFLPVITGTNAAVGSTYLLGCLIILPYKGRLLAFNTTEGTSLPTAQSYPQRVRWSQNGTPFNKKDQSGADAPLPTNFNGGSDSNNQAWSSDVIGKGGFLDAPTLEKIISAEFVYDSLVVYFERSTWQLRYTGNELLPFIWEKINTELGAYSTFSIIPLDHRAVAFGNVGIHACDTVEVKRIDQKIPDEVFLIQNINNGPQRIYGVRDYQNQLLYWSAPYLGATTENDNDDEGSQPFDAQNITYPNKIFVFNYIDGSFSFFNDSFTCFGYFQSPTSITWNSTYAKETTWKAADRTWIDPSSIAFYLDIVAGNQQGYVEILNQQSFNDVSLTITNIIPGSGTTTISCINHNLQQNQFIKILTCSGINGLAGTIYKVSSVINANTFLIQTDVAPTGTFTGNGSIAVVNNISILSKKFNPFLSNGTQVRLKQMDLFFDNEPQGQVTVQLLLNEDDTTEVNESLIDPPSNIFSAITNITSANPCVMTVVDGTKFSEGDVIFITNVSGMTEINNLGVTINTISGNILTLELDSSTFSAYTNSGYAWNITKNAGPFVNTFPETTYQASPDKNLVNKKLWKRIYFKDISQLFQYNITFNDIQMKCEPIVSADIELHGVILWFQQAGRLINV